MDDRLKTLLSDIGRVGDLPAAERARCIDLVNFALNPYGTKGERRLCDNIITAIQEQLK